MIHIIHIAMLSHHFIVCIDVVSASVVESAGVKGGLVLQEAVDIVDSDPGTGGTIMHTSCQYHYLLKLDAAGRPRKLNFEMVFKGKLKAPNSYNPSYSVSYLRGKPLIGSGAPVLLFCISVVLLLESPPMRRAPWNHAVGKAQAECFTRRCLSLRETVQSSSSLMQVS